MEFKDMGISKQKKIRNIASKYKGLESIELSMLGKYQIENASLAISCAFALKQLGFNISEDVIKTGIKATKVPYRFEIIEKGFVLDGAHNPDAVQELCVSLKDVFPNQKVIFVIGVMQDKDCVNIIQNIFNAEFVRAVVCTQGNSTRFLSASELRKEFKKHFDSSINILEEADFQKAIQLSKFIQNSSEDKLNPVICVCGSLNLLRSNESSFCLP